MAICLRFVLISLLVFAAKPVASFSQIKILAHSPSEVYDSFSHASPEDKAGGDSRVPSKFIIALTREKGKNDKLRNALLSHERIQEISETFGMSVQIHEVPCIEHADGPETDKLAPTLASSLFDYVAVTSPEAANVLGTAWIEAGRPSLGMVAAVGKATQEALAEFNIDVAFVPSKATAATLVEELPPSSVAVKEGRATTIFYPASAKAQDILQIGLEERGFSVLRLNTYDTVTASWDADQASLAQSATVACFASPSAVKAWLKNTAQFETPRALASCIGETSASACRKNHWEENNIFFPEKPGVDGWAIAVADALEHIAKSDT